MPEFHMHVCAVPLRAFHQWPTVKAYIFLTFKIFFKIFLFDSISQKFIWNFPFQKFRFNSFQPKWYYVYSLIWLLLLFFFFYNVSLLKYLLLPALGQFLPFSTTLGKIIGDCDTRKARIFHISFWLRRRAWNKERIVFTRKICGGTVVEPVVPQVRKT